MQIDKTTTMRLAAMVAGVVYMTVCYKVPAFIQQGPFWHVLSAFAVLSPITFVLAAFSEKESWLIALFVFLGVAIGVIIDAAFDKVSRNLFPFEIVWWAALYAPAVITGVVLDWLVRKYRRRT